MGAREQGGGTDTGEYPSRLTSWSLKGFLTCEAHEKYAKSNAEQPQDKIHLHQACGEGRTRLHGCTARRTSRAVQTRGTHSVVTLGNHVDPHGDEGANGATRIGAPYVGNLICNTPKTCKGISAPNLACGDFLKVVPTGQEMSQLVVREAGGLNSLEVPS